MIKYLPLKWLSIFIAPMIATLITVYVFWPGSMSWDSIYQLRQARFGIIDNFHPPLMVYIWRPLDRILPGPGLILVLQNILFYFSLAYILYYFLKSPILTTILLLSSMGFLPTLGLLAVIWKDTLMMGFFMAAFAFLLHADSKNSKIALVASLVFCFCGVACRHNALPAAIPIWVYAGYITVKCFPHAQERFAFKKIILIPVILLSITIVNLVALDAINTYNIPYKMGRFPYTDLIISDLMGLSYFSGVNLLAPCLYQHHADFSQQDIKNIYFPQNPQLSYWPGYLAHKNYSGKNKSENFKLLSLNENCNSKKLESYWYTAISNYPWEYLKHRWTVSKIFLGIYPYCPVMLPTYDRIDSNDLGVVNQERQVKKIVMSHILGQINGPFYRAVYLYLLGLVLLILIALIRVDGWHLLALIGLSASFYLLPLFFIASVGDYRYQSWGVAGTFLILEVSIGKFVKRIL